MEKTPIKYLRANPLAPNLTVDQYRKAKMVMLQRDMHITLTYEQKQHFYGLKNEIQIDNYARKVMFDAWGE